MRPELAHLFTRPFWLDEWHTNLVANRATLSQLFSDLYHASDMGPPVLHLLGWTTARFTGGHVSPVGARIVSFSAILLALAFVFALLRRRFGRTASVAGTLALASHHLVVFHAFEFRYYGLWLGVAAAFAWALGVDEERASRRRDVAVALFSILLVLTHWLAVLSLGLMCVGSLAAHGPNWRGGLRRVIPAAAGFVVLAASSPLLLAQRAAVKEKSWMADADLGDVIATVRMYWAGTALILAILIILSTLLFEATKEPVKASVARTVRDPSAAALLSLIALPLSMALLSTRYPAMHERYSIATLLAWPPVIAIAVAGLVLPVADRILRYSLRAMLGFLFAVMVFFLWASALNAAVQSSLMVFSVDAGRKALGEACGMNVPVVFQTRHLMYPATDGLSPRWNSCDTRLLAMSNATLDSMYPPTSSVPRFFRFENEIARLHQRLYGMPKVFAQAELDSLPRFVLVGWDDSLPLYYKNAESFGKAVFPRHRVRRINDNLALFER